MIVYARAIKFLIYFNNKSSIYGMIMQSVGC